jgi:uncharacterized protein YbaR (Trm112 family)
MRSDLVDILACPMCKGPLTLEVVTSEADEVIAGTLHCPACNEDYPVADGIPNLLPPEMRRAMDAEAARA